VTRNEINIKYCSYIAYQFIARESAILQLLAGLWTPRIIIEIRNYPTHSPLVSTTMGIRVVGTIVGRVVETENNIED